MTLIGFDVVVSWLAIIGGLSLLWYAAEVLILKRSSLFISDLVSIVLLRAIAGPERARKKAEDLKRPSRVKWNSIFGIAVGVVLLYLGIGSLLAG
jgi:uncharacterized membrane protein YfcA